ncbi:MAG: GTPase HflX [Candidatus Aminicenantes bacterium]|nr:GTPase HflX [Candidatus Aminicenantes bacterium]
MEKAILVHLISDKGGKLSAADSLHELEGLAHSAGAEVVHKIVQTRPGVDPRYLIGSGKVEEIGLILQEKGAELVIFNRRLSSIQQRSLEDKLEVKVIDRTQLILDIFAQRARSSEGKLQVELAQLNYLLPRLTGKGTAMSRLGGGIGTRGPGETKLEIDRRRIQERITKIRREIRRVQTRREGRIRNRCEGPIPFVSLVGYTNAGKSTLFNALTREKAFTSSQLFATLDPIHRRVSFSDGTYYFLSDTVGFIRKLPEELLTAFMATLVEVREADCIGHVIDCSSPVHKEHIQAVEGILDELGVGDTPILKIYNKIDNMPDGRRFLVNNTANAASGVYISAKNGWGISHFQKTLQDILFGDFRTYHLQIPRSHSDLITSFSQWAIILKKWDGGDIFHLKVLAKPDKMRPYTIYINRGESPW